MKALSRIVSVLIFIFGIIGCARVYEATIKDPGNADLAGFKTYRWVSNSPQITGNIKDDKISIDSQIRRTVDQILSEKGYSKVDNGGADFLVNYKFDVQQKTKVLPVGDSYTSVNERTVGKLTLSTINPQLQQLAWSGSSDTEVYSDAFMHNKIKVFDRAIKVILDSFPESKKK
jgi:hypothetical protein